MYQNVNLEKGMYHITGMSFAQVLEAADPSAEYAGTGLEKLDAFERQLKRFDIRVSGADCDRVEKFFTTTQSAVLFPEYVRRMVRSGLEESPLGRLIAVRTATEDGSYQPAVFSDTAAYTTPTVQANDLPTATFQESGEVLFLEKYGRSIHATYEALRRQRLDVFGAMLRSVGIKLAAALTKKAVQTLYNGRGSLVNVTTAGTLTYADLTKLIGAFSNYSLGTLLCAPSVAAKIAALEEMREQAAQGGQIYLPFGAELVKAADMSDAYIIGLDSRFALEMVTAQDVVLETDKMIDAQLDVMTVAMRTAFRVLIPDAVHALKLN